MSEQAFCVESAGPELWPLVRDSVLRHLEAEWPYRGRWNEPTTVLDDVRRAMSRGLVFRAFLPEVPEETCGLIVYEPAIRTVAWAYVKQPYRGNGLMWLLAGAAGVTFNLSKAVGVRVWTRQCTELAAAGKLNLYPVIETKRPKPVKAEAKEEENEAA